MATTYTPEKLRDIFSSPFDMQQWYAMLRDYFHVKILKVSPEKINGQSSVTEDGYYLGCIEEDYIKIGLFYYDVKQGSVVNKRTGLRNLVKTFFRPNSSQLDEFDAALVVFNSQDHWRLSFVSDIKGESTSPRRYTYVLGEKDKLYNTPVARFCELQQKGITFNNIKDAFSVEALTKQFYNDLFEWYLWATSNDAGISFPNNTAIEDDDRENIDIKIIRMITRIMFVWFIKQKGLVPDCLFQTDFLKGILKDFNPQDTKSGTYYNAILQNLFFATLNRAITDENGTRGFAKAIGRHDIKSLYRYAELFSITEDEVIKMFGEIPFLNGGLFECLDKTKTIDGVEQAYNYDGFSRNDKKFADGRYRNRAVVPNVLFFKPEKGLFSILSRYNFTIEENTPNEQQVALDPELLGKVFENLLGAYNPETQKTARNQSGSFYTPREIVNYMVDESLMAYLGKSDTVENLFSDNFTKDDSKNDEYAAISQKLKAVKVLDPACGSGAFPMGLLNRIVDILHKIDPEVSTYRLKLSIIENCIYGSDKQSIAIQITKLRFFISLICDCDKDLSKPNFGIPTLPNLETKFVAADSLIGLEKSTGKQASLFDDPEILPTKEELKNIRHRHFEAKSVSAKQRLRNKDMELRTKLAKLLADNKDYALNDAKQMAQWNPYDQNSVSPFFDPDWMFGIADGFDIIIGNPPYIQLQDDGGKLAKLYEHQGYKTFARTGDIYCLFYERGWQLLKDGGHLCYITSNKWMRAGYGEKTRGFFAQNTNPMLLIDFAGTKVFESATVDTNIMLFSKSSNRHETTCAIVNKQVKTGINNLSLFVEQQHTVCPFSNSDSWVILSPIEQSIKRKIEAVGIPLKDWDIQINYGIKTGCNEAFIITTDKRNEILSNCNSDEERQRTEELIRPILRGRDIKRYSYDWAGRWLIATFPSRHYDIEQYPAVKDYLLSFGIERLEQTGKTYVINGETVKARKKTNNKWFETQDSISYWEDFDKPKIIWKIIGNRLGFALEKKRMVLNNACYILTCQEGNLEYLEAVLNSNPILWYSFITNMNKTGVGDMQVGAQNINILPIPKHPQEENTICKLVKEICTNGSVAMQVENIISDIYGFSNEEQNFLSNFAKNIYQ